MAESGSKPIVIGLYGIPGSGKSYMLQELEAKAKAGQRGRDSVRFYEGSEVIANLVPGGLDSFKHMPESQKKRWRTAAIHQIRDECLDAGVLGVVTGHFMFWPEVDQHGTQVWTHADAEVYTHIIYLDTPAEDILERCNRDTKRFRPSTSVQHIDKWKDEEKARLQKVAYEHRIVFCPVAKKRLHPAEVSRLAGFFADWTEEQNQDAVNDKLRTFVQSDHGRPNTYLVWDADKTLSPKDATVDFWNKHFGPRPKPQDPLKLLFASPMSYSYTAFMQATILYDEVDEAEFDRICTSVAAKTELHSEVLELFLRMARQEHVGILVVTCGLSLIWKKVIQRYGFSGMVSVLGNGRFGGLFSELSVITPKVKADLVSRLQSEHGMRVCAFGDSPLDIPMLRQADLAVVVVGEQGHRSNSMHPRSNSMDPALANAITTCDLRAYQVLLPESSEPRLDTTKLPIIDLDGNIFRDFVARGRHRLPQVSDKHNIQVVHATDSNAAKVLMTPTRNAMNSGPILGAAHRQVGWYLATEYLSELVGVEEYPLPHVQETITMGYKLARQEKTLIVAVMRAGEMMAMGVYDAMPDATFLHASRPQDITDRHLHEDGTVVLVDFVINSGETIAAFVQHICRLNMSVHIVMLAGVVQSEAMVNSRRSTQKLSLVALRISTNKYKGRGHTDTGNRLFNTVFLD
ncbi:uracil phosphoribosyltransferase-domain-containing protein [Xylariaceae sp. FL0804]|nr:uracil phosphoribosyltransferase-domain-containing protein [Xylariaceae sp. FL0804]